MINLIDLDKIVERLNLIDPAICSNVGSVFDIEEIVDGAGADLAPAIWCYSAGTDVSGPEGLGHGRIITESIGVACVINIACPEQDGPDGRMVALRGAVAGLLDDWRHTPRWSPLLYVAGQPEARNEQILVWVETYTTQVGNHG